MLHTFLYNKIITYYDREKKKNIPTVVGIEFGEDCLLEPPNSLRC